MKHFYLCALAFFTLFAVSCSKNDDKPAPVDPPKPADSTIISFTYGKIGNTELYYLGKDSSAVKISKGTPGRSFSYEIAGSNGLKLSSDTLVKGTGILDNKGNAVLRLHGLDNYKDGVIKLKFKFIDANAAVEVNAQKAEYEIRNYLDFIYMAPYRNSDSSDHYIQVQDFAFPDTVFTTAVFTKTFYGSYDGQGFKITNLAINSPGLPNATQRIGLFYFTSNNVLKNIRLELSDKGIIANKLMFCGGLAGWAKACVITNCSVRGNVQMAPGIVGYPGGICGMGDGVKMTGCSFKGRISGSTIGGLIGSMSASTINMCYAYFTFEAKFAGGIAGLRATDDTIANRVSNSYVMIYDYTLPTFVAMGPVDDTTTIATNCFANAGTAPEGVPLYDSPVDINTQLAAITVTDWPAWVPAPADKKPFKHDETDHTGPMKLWWE